MTDVFKVQDEIASDVVAALKVKLLPTQQLPNTQRTNNTEAYEHYLLGIDIFRQNRLETSQLAAAEFQKAIALDQTTPTLTRRFDSASRAADVAPSRRSVQRRPSRRLPRLNRRSRWPGPGFGLQPSRIPSPYSRLELARCGRGFQTSSGAGSQQRRVVVLLLRELFSVDARLKRSPWLARRP